jgi:hypothetical protein
MIVGADSCRRIDSTVLFQEFVLYKSYCFSLVICSIAVILIFASDNGMEGYPNIVRDITSCRCGMFIPESNKRVIWICRLIAQVSQKSSGLRMAPLLGDCWLCSDILQGTCHISATLEVLNRQELFLP